MKFIQKILIALFGLTFGLIGIFIIFLIFSKISTWLFPSLFTQLFVGVETRCDTLKKCSIPLHEITLFKWDKAYFFPLKHGYGYEANIPKITGIYDYLNYDTYQPSPNILAIFTYKNKLVNYTTFSSLYGDFYEHNPMVSGEKSDFFIKLNTDKDELRSLHYSGNLNDFSKNDIEIYYYEVTPQNDVFDAGCFIENYAQLSVKQCGFNFTNLDQVHLFNPKIDKK